MRAAADLGRQGPRTLRDHGTDGDNPQVKTPAPPVPFHDPSATAGREKTGRTDPAAGLQAIGVAFGPAANIIFGRAETARDIKAILLATLGR
jgi:hypothetical protein